MATDGSSETPVVSEPGNNVLIGMVPRRPVCCLRATAAGGWRSGRFPSLKGALQSKATLVKDNIGSSWSLGLASSGTLYVWRRAGAVMVKVAALDMPRGSLVDAPGETFERFVDSRDAPTGPPMASACRLCPAATLVAGPAPYRERTSERAAFVTFRPDSRYVQYPRLSPDGEPCGDQRA